MSKLYFSLIFLFIVFQKGNGQSLEKGVTSDKSYFAKKAFQNFKVTDFQLQVNGEILNKDKTVSLKKYRLPSPLGVPYESKEFSKDSEANKLKQSK